MPAFSPYTNLGFYNLGIPSSVSGATVLGLAERGVRASYLFFFEALLQAIFHSYWDKIYIFFCLILPFVSMFFFMYRQTKDKSAAFISGFLYMVNPWVVVRLGSGNFIEFSLSYALLPFFYILMQELIELKNLARLIKIGFLFGIFFLLLLFLSPHFIVIAGIIIACSLFMYKKNFKRNVLRSFIALCMGGSFLIISTAFFWLPSLLFRETSLLNQLQSGGFSLASLRFNGGGATVQNLLRLDPIGYPFLPKPMTVKRLFEYFYFLPVFILLLKWKKLFVFILILFVGFFLAKGLNPPFVALSTIMYKNIFFLHPFRDPTKFVSLIIFSLSCLWGYMYFWFPEKWKVPFFIIYLGWLLLINQIFLTGNFGNRIIPFILPKQYTKVSNWLIAQHVEGRIIYLPSSPGMGNYTWYPKALLPSVNNNIFDGLVPLTQPLANSFDSPESLSSQYMLFTENNIRNDEILPQLLTKAGIEYILFDTSFTNAYKNEVKLSEVNKTLNGSHFLKKVKSIGSVDVYENTLYKSNSIYSSKNTIIPVVGDLSFYRYLPIDLIDTPVVFLNENENYKLLNSLHNATIYFLNQNKDDLIYEMLKNEYLIDTTTPFWEGEQGWSFLGYDMKQFISRSGVIFTSKQAIDTFPYGKGIIPFSVVQNGQYIIAVKTLNQSQGGKFTLTLDKKNYILDTLSPIDEFTWRSLNVGFMKKGNYVISLKNGSAGLQVIDGIEVIPQEDYKQTLRQVSSILAENNKVTLYSPQKRIKILLSPLKNSELLYGYSSFWRVDNKKPIIGDYYTNLFVGKLKAKPQLLYDNIYYILYISDAIIIFFSSIYCFYLFNKNFKK